MSFLKSLKSSVPPHQQLVPIPLIELVDNILGDAHYCSISPLVGKLIESVTQNKHTVFVQWIDFDDTPLSRPILWRLSAWLDSTERRRIQKEYAQKQREIGWIRQANVEGIARAILKKWLIKEEQAKLIGNIWLRKIERKEEGIEERILWHGYKLKTKVEEI